MIFLPFNTAFGKGACFKSKDYVLQEANFLPTEVNSEKIIFT